MPATADPPELCRARRRLLRAARCRFAEDSLADAVSAGLRQAVLFGGALDTFASHNPYAQLRVFEFAGDADFESVLTATDFDASAPVFVIRLGYRADAPAHPLPRPGALAPGSEIVFDYLPAAAGPPSCPAGWQPTVTGHREPPRAENRSVPREVRWEAPGEQHPEQHASAAVGAPRDLLLDDRWEVLADLDPRTLAARYLRRPIAAALEPRVVRARIRPRRASDRA
ncbi:class I SAM-dependent methyltransferase [Nocardia sp. NPDC057668]|uniref:class I SAM-dependent methyltransferase n=1 Tax=Nocardia sp. NPDC057668 TaxID=3346202 RepID=UPI00366ABA31